MTLTYADKLKDPRWQKKRLEIFQRDNWKCQICGEDKETLHIHHLAYFYCEPWDYLEEHLITLCELCHALESSQDDIDYYTTLMGAYQNMYHSQSDAEVEYYYNQIQELKAERCLCVG